MSDELKAQDCELEYWNQQAEDYAQVQIPCEDLRAIINRAWEAPAFNSALTAAEAERNRAQLACQQIAERLTAANARAEAAEARVGELQDRLDGTQCDLNGALDVLWRRGDDEARQWILLNYLRHFEGRANAEQLAKLDAERKSLGLPSRTSIQDAP